MVHTLEGNPCTYFFMEVQNSSSAWLSDFEVFQLLQESKETRNSGIKLPENILTVEFEVSLTVVMFSFDL